MIDDAVYDLAIIGGGLAGLSLSILAARHGHRVVVFEKETYPFHKVCGEYISMESWGFLERLGLPLSEWQLPFINHLVMTSPTGVTLQAGLPLGGFGISRYKLDSALADLAKKEGVHLMENTKVSETVFTSGKHEIRTTAGLFTAAVTAACYGKKANLDVKWKRRFLMNGEKENYVGVKYHVTAKWPAHQIGLHNFSGGYCGISQIENDRYCLCYLTKSENLKKNGQSIRSMEGNILKKILC